MRTEATVQRAGTFFRNDEPQRLYEARVFELAIHKRLTKTCPEHLQGLLVSKCELILANVSEVTGAHLVRVCYQRRHAFR